MKRQLIYRIITKGNKFRCQRKIWRGWKTILGPSLAGTALPLDFNSEESAERHIRDEVRERKVRAVKWRQVKYFDFGSDG